MAASAPILTMHPLSCYSFGTKAPKIDKDTSIGARMERLRDKYAKEGARRSVDGVLFVHDHGHPHILLIQIGQNFFKLPGGRLRPGEDEEAGLLRKLDTLLAPEAENLKPEWKIGECIGTFYRPNFENLMYPYCPAHIVRPKEIRRQLLVHLPEKCYLAIPKNMKLLAVPLFEVYDHMSRYGPIISAVPLFISRFQIAMTSGGAVDGEAVEEEATEAIDEEKEQQRDQET